MSVVLNACSHTNQEVERSDALEVALQAQDMLIHDLVDSDRCESQVFKNSMNVFDNLIIDKRERISFINALFHRYCKDGLVNESVLKMLRRSCPSLYYNLGAKGQDIDLKALPADWSRAVKPGRK